MARFTPSTYGDADAASADAASDGGSGWGAGFLSDLIDGAFGLGTAAIDASQEKKASAYATDKAEETNLILGALGFEDSAETRDMITNIALIAGGTVITVAVLAAVAWKASQE